MTGQEARDDERERAAWAAIAEGLGGLGYELNDEEETRQWVLDYLLPARKHPEPEITDEMVERGLNGWMNLSAADAEQPAWREWRSRYERYMRAALEAALGVPVGEGEQG